MRKTHVSADGSGSAHQITENAWVRNAVHSPQIICPSDPYQFDKISPQISTPRPVADSMMKIQRFIIVEKPRGYSGNCSSSDTVFRWLFNFEVGNLLIFKWRSFIFTDKTSQKSLLLDFNILSTAYAHTVTSGCCPTPRTNCFFYLFFIYIFF